MTTHNRRVKNLIVGKRRTLSFDLSTLFKATGDFLKNNKDHVCFNDGETEISLAEAMGDADNVRALARRTKLKREIQALVQDLVTHAVGTACRSIPHDETEMYIRTLERLFVIPKSFYDDALEQAEHELDSEFSCTSLNVKINFMLEKVEDLLCQFYESITDNLHDFEWNEVEFTIVGNSLRLKFGSDIRLQFYHQHFGNSRPPEDPAEFFMNKATEDDSDFE